MTEKIHGEKPTDKLGWSSTVAEYELAYNILYKQCEPLVDQVEKENQVVEKENQRRRQRTQA